jgi:hypothetical protein
VDRLWLVAVGVPLTFLGMLMLAFNTPCGRGGRVRLGVDFPMVRNGNVLLRVCDIWASR